MADVKWIKIATDIFDDEKILLIESLPSSDALIVIWFKLLCLAGKNNNDGVFLMNDRIAYTDEMLATIFRKDVNTVRLALKTFEDFGMIQTIDGVVTIPNWDKHQDFAKIKARNEYMKKYMADKRAKQKALISCRNDDVNDAVNTDVNVNNNINSDANVNANVNVNNNANVNNQLDDSLTDCKQTCKQPVSDAEIDKEDNKYNKDTKINRYDSEQKEPVPDSSNEYLSDLGIVSIPEFLKDIMDEWNSLQDTGIKPIRSIEPESNRAFKIYSDIKEFGRSSFTTCIENIKNSDYLLGKAPASLGTISFDWFIERDNYLKVYEDGFATFTKNAETEEKTTKRPKDFARGLSSYSNADWKAIEEELLDN